MFPFFLIQDMFEIKPFRQNISHKQILHLMISSLSDSLFGFTQLKLWNHNVLFDMNTLLDCDISMSTIDANERVWTT